MEWPPEGHIVPIELDGLAGVAIQSKVTICNLGEDSPGRLGLFNVPAPPLSPNQFVHRQPFTATRHPRTDSLSNLARVRLT